MRWQASSNVLEKWELDIYETAINLGNAEGNNPIAVNKGSARVEADDKRERNIV